MLQLMPLEEDDLYAYQTIFAEAFKNDLMAVMYPNGYSEEDKQFGIDFNLKQWREHPERVKLMKIIDTELPDDDANRKIVGGSKWQFFSQDRTEAELEEDNKDPTDRVLPAGLNVPFFKAFVDSIKRCKQELIGGKAHAMLSVLFTRPSYYRRGLGAMHLDWGLRQADEVGDLLAWLVFCCFINFCGIAK